MLPRMDSKIDSKSIKKRTWAHLAPPRLTLAPPGKLWGYPPAQKRTKINRKRISKHENPDKNDAVRKRSRNTRRWPKFSTAAVTPLGVFHKNSHCEVLLPGVSIGSLLLLASFLSAADWAKPIWIRRGSPLGLPLGVVGRRSSCQSYPHP